MELWTSRLHLRPFTGADFDAFLPLDQDERVMRYVRACKPAPESPREARERFDRILAYYRKFPGFGVFATCLRDGGEMIGWTALKDLDGSEMTEIGYRYFYRHWGQGYATEAAGALISYGFREMGLDRIVAVVHPENGASRRVLGKLGLTLIGPARYYETDVLFYETHQQEAVG